MARSTYPPSREPVRTFAPYAALAVSLLVTLVMARYVAEVNRQAEREQFADFVAQARAAIDTRLQTYVATLRAGAALFSASDEVDADEFRRFAESIDLQAHYPGILGIGFSKRIDGDVAAFEESIRATGRRGFQVWPKDPRDEHHAIIYLEPLDRRNQAAIGYDMFTEETRRAAMERARDTGAPAASGKVRLVQEIDEDKQPGFLIYVPVYASGHVPETVEQRRAELVGFVYAPFRGHDLFNGIFGTLGTSEVGFRIHDDADAAGDRLLHHAALPPGHIPRLTSFEPFNAEGRRWTIEFFSLPELENQMPRSLVWIVGAAGVALSLVLFGLMRSQEQARQAAERTSGELRASEAALRRSENRFRQLFDADLVGVTFGTADGRLSDINQVTARITGYTREQALRGEIRWDTLTPPEYHERDAQAVEEMRLRGACTPYEKQLIRADGRRVPILIGAARMEGTEDEMVALIVDLTERKRYEQAISEARNAAEAASRLKDEFLATVSHELRTPLNAILGWTELLRQNLHLPADVHRGLETIERNARSQAQLIEDLLDVSRIISGKMRLSVHPTDVTPLIDAAVEAVRPAAQAKGVQLVRAIEPRLPPVLADPVRLQQVVWNLLSNGIKFTPRGGTVAIRADACDGQMQIVVEDTGAGIDPAFLPHVFERFRQADSSSTRRHGGLGLGLAIVRHLVEAHGGTVTAESAGLGSGALFRVTLPALPSPSDDATAGAEPALVNGDASLQGVRALVVDDEPDARELMVRVLEARGATVVATESAADALREAAGGFFDVLLADISMPIQDGYDLIARIRAGENGRRLPAIAVTAQARAQDRERALAAGYQVHLAKPIHGEELCQAVAQLLRASA